MLAGCVARDDAQHQHRHRPCARRRGCAVGHRAQGRCCGRQSSTLNDQEGGKPRCAPTSMPGGRWWSRAGGSHCDERLRLRCDGERNTATCSGTMRNTPPRPSASAPSHATCQNCCPPCCPSWQPLQAVSQPDTLYAYHPLHPCSMGKAARGGVESHLNQFRLRCALRAMRHTCAGWLGGHVFCAEPRPSHQLRDRKLGVLNRSLGEQPPDMILSANIGCITHLQSGTARRYGTGGSAGRSPRQRDLSHGVAAFA